MIKLLVDNTVDAIQTSKKIFVDTFVKHEGLAKTMTEFVDAQTEYTKKAIDVGFTTASNMHKTVTDKSFYTDTIKSVQESAQTIFNTQKKKEEGK
jgi:hypothetical protein